MGVPGENVHRQQLENAAHQHIDHGPARVAVGLHNGGGDKDYGIKNDGNGQNPHQTCRKHQLLSGVKPQQGGDGFRENRKTDGAGHGNEACDPGSGFLRSLCFLIVEQGKLGGDGGDDADGDGGNKGAGHVEDGLGHAVNAPDGIRLTLGHAGSQKPTHVDLGFQHGENLQPRRAHGNGNGDDQQAPGRGGKGIGGLSGVREVPEAFPEDGKEVHRAHQAACGDTQNGAAGSQGDAVCSPEQGHGGKDSHHQLYNRLQNLGDGGGEHIPLALEVAPEGTHDADQQHAGTETANGGPGVGLVLELGKLAAKHRHQEGPPDAQP